MANLKDIFDRFVGREVSVIQESSGDTRATPRIAGDDPTIAEISRAAQNHGLRLKVEVKGGIISRGGNSYHRVAAFVAQDGKGTWRVQSIQPG